MPDLAEPINRTPNRDCPACQEKRLHTPLELRQYHHFAGHGMTKEQGWSHPDLIPAKAVPAK
jgi:hypothetical protein